MTRSAFWSRIENKVGQWLTSLGSHHHEEGDISASLGGPIPTFYTAFEMIPKTELVDLEYYRSFIPSTSSLFFAIPFITLVPTLVPFI